MTTTTLHPEEVEAAELEGFLEISGVPGLVALYAGYKTQRAVAAAANKVKGGLADRILEALEKLDALVFTLHGQPVMRKQVTQDKTVFNEADFKRDHPELHARYMTKTVKGTIKVWVRSQDGDDITLD